jgi:hypothetical protein
LRANWRRGGRGHGGKRAGPIGFVEENVPSQARREARKRLTAAKAFMLNEWQRKRLLVRPSPCSYAPVGNNWKPRHARPGPRRTISPSGSRTEGRNIPSTSAWLRDEAYPRGGRTEIKRSDDRRTEAWRRASGIAPCWAGAARSPEGRSVSPPPRRSDLVMQRAATSMRS